MKLMETTLLYLFPHLPFSFPSFSLSFLSPPLLILYFSHAASSPLPSPLSYTLLLSPILSHISPARGSVEHCKLPSEIRCGASVANAF